MNILAIHDGHNASVALLVNGRIVASAQEERFRNVKNYMGFPGCAISWALEYAKLHPEDIDIVALASLQHWRPFDVTRIRDVFKKQKVQFYRSWLRETGRKTPLLKIKTGRERKQLERNLAKSGLKTNKLRFIEHHLCHAAAAYYGSQWRDKVLVLTIDGGGDMVTATVSIGSGVTIERLAATPATNSVGNIYSRVTFMMGFTPWEHEYKVMGLAPYASKENSDRLKRIFDSYLTLSSINPLVFERKISEPTFLIYRRLSRDFELERFDNIAGGLQAFTEDILLKWIRAAVLKTGIKKLALAGGVFMNVKANKLIAEMPEIENVFVFPSCGDESNPVGAAFQAYVEETGQPPEPIGPIYWGPEFTANEVEGAIKEASKECKFGFEEKKDIESTVTDLLLEHKIVARAAGRMEFGARALGNRTILADPADLVNVQTINQMIKIRDFWMPFAPVILAERQDDYIVRSKPVMSPYMMFAFDTQRSRRREMIAAVHQADGTARPQVIEKDWNPPYYEIVRKFEDKTGRGALLNTSFNLHGYPITRGPAEALWVFKNSGLEYLALGDYLIHKK